MIMTPEERAATAVEMILTGLTKLEMWGGNFVSLERAYELVNDIEIEALRDAQDDDTTENKLSHDVWATIAFLLIEQMAMKHAAEEVKKSNT